MINANIDDIKRVKALFNMVLSRASNPSTAIEVVATKGWKDVIEHFQNEEGPNGSWPGLKHTRPRGGNKILQDTGRLRAANRWRVAGKNEAHVYNHVNYAGIHNRGGTIKVERGSGYSTYTIPQRKFLWISEKAKDSMVTTLLRWIVRGRL